MSQNPRLATEKDRPAVEAIVKAAYSRYVPRIGREPAPMLDDYAARIREGQVHILDWNGVVQGIVVLIPEADAMLLDNVAAAPMPNGMDSGRKLLAFAEQAALAAGYGSIRLYTNEMMTENIALYSRLGYCETHRGEEKGSRRVYMTKVLAD